MPRTRHTLPRPLSCTTFARRPVLRDPLLDEVIAVIDAAPIRDEQIREDGRLVFGDHDVDGTVRINVRLLRVVVALHELTHRAHPEWPEADVRSRSLRLLHMLTDDDVAALDARLVTAMRRRRATRVRAARSSSA